MAVFVAEMLVANLVGLDRIIAPLFLIWFINLDIAIVPSEPLSSASFGGLAFDNVVT